MKQYRLFFNLVCWLGITCLSPSWGQTRLSTDRPSGIYEVHELISFVVESAHNGIAQYTIFQDRFAPPLATGNLQLSPGARIPIAFQADRPGSLICRLTIGGQQFLAGAVVAPFALENARKVPTNLMTFWNTQLSELATIPIQPALELFEETNFTQTYRISLASIDNRRVYGWLSVPKSTGPFPAILTLPAFGDSPGLVSPDVTTAERGGALALSISIHNAPTDQFDPQAYQPDVLTNPDSLYHKWSVLAAVRAIDYLFTRSDFDGHSLAVNGVSQGGGLATIVAGLDERVQLLVYSNAALAQHHGLYYDQASGFPYYLNQSRNTNGSAEHEMATLQATEYIDALYFAQQFTGPSLGFTGYLDTICPSATVLMLHNQLRGPKTMGLFPTMGHTHPEEYWEGRYQFYRRHFPAMQNPPWPWPSTEIGYFAEAGPSQTIDLGNSATLTGVIEQEGIVNSSWKVLWELEEGPAAVRLSTPDEHQTQAHFTSPGTYRFRFSAFDDEALDQVSPRYFVISDVVEIQVN